MSISIIPATLRDISYVAANMTDADWAECAAQLPEGSTPIEVAYLSHAADSGHNYIVTRRGQPIAAFGVCQDTFRPWAWKAWMYGTADAPRAVPEISRFGLDVIKPSLLRQGATRLEAISHADHLIAHGWLERLGAVRRCALKGYGRGGADFILYEWTRHGR